MTEPAAGVGRRFHLLELLGEGAYGEVYLAEQDSGAGFRRTVAVKLLHERVAKSRDAGQRMRDEARILGMLAHRNIVNVLDLIRLDERWAVIMDHVPGADLEQVLDATEKAELTIPLPAALSIGAGVCAALDCAHNARDRDGNALQIVHRDIKPSNVRLTDDGEVKVLDFGVARVQSSTREAETRGAAWLGTERYMAPERILCESDGPEGDVYATAATVFELIAGRPLGRTPVLDERHIPFVEGARAAVLDRVPDANGAALADLLAQALHQDPAERPTAGDLGRQLRDLARASDGEDLFTFCDRFLPTLPDHLELKRRPATGVLSEDVTGLSEIGAPTLAPPPEPEPSPSRLPMWLAFFAMSGGVAALVVGVFALGLALVPFLIGWPTDASAPSDTPVVIEPAPPVMPEPGDPPAVEPIVSEPAVKPSPAPPERPASASPEPAPNPSPAPTPATAPQPTAPDNPTVSSAMVVLPGASSLTVTCGDQRFAGTASVRLRSFPAGTCRIEAVHTGSTLAADVGIASRREVRCRVEGGTLACS